MPARERACRTFCTSNRHDNGIPFSSRNNGPVDCGRRAIYDNTAATGHKMLPVAPTVMETLAPNTSVLLWRRETVIQVGLRRLSICMSEGDSIKGVYAFHEGQVNSPALMKAKKPRQQAAHRATVLKSGD